MKKNIYSLGYLLFVDNMKTIYHWLQFIKLLTTGSKYVM